MAVYLHTIRKTKPPEKEKLHMNDFHKAAPLLSPSYRKATGALPSRDEIAAESKWNLADIYADDAAYDADRAALGELLRRIERCKGALGQIPQLVECLRLRDAIGVKCESLFAYARMHRDTDANNAAYQKRTSEAESLLAEAATATSFIEPELLAADRAALTEAFAAEEALQPYRFYFENLLRQNAHVLSPREEALLATLSEVLQAPSNIYTILTNADLKFPQTRDDSGEKIELSEGRYSALIQSGDRKVRKAAFKKLFGTYAAYRNTLATTYNSLVKTATLRAKIRNYDSSLAAALDRANIPAEVYTRLIETVHAHLGPLHRYVEVKRAALDVNRLHAYDLYAPLGRRLRIHIPYAEGVELVSQALKPLGERYLSDLQRAVKSGWIDVYESRGKRTGAYSWGVYGIHPFVLLNYDGRYGAASTLAHELGHAMHSYYSNATQPYVNASYTIFCAEVASTVNENLLLDYMLETETDPRKRLFYLNQYLEQVRTTVYRQTLFAEFEMRAHALVEAGQALTADALEELWLELNRKYYGEALVLDGEIRAEWSRIPHFYRPFYVYQYATGYSAATALARALQTEGEAARARYLRYLQSGGSAYSVELLKAAGVDMTAPAPIEVTLQKFAQRLAAFETAQNT